MRPRPKGGKKGRKIGKGVHKLAQSVWGSYDALMKNQSSRRKENLLRRFCSTCRVQFHSRGSKNLHNCVDLKEQQA